MEHGGVIEDIDLTTDDWVNVNPLEIMKRYDMIRRYVRIRKQIPITWIISLKDFIDHLEYLLTWDSGHGHLKLNLENDYQWFLINKATAKITHLKNDYAKLDAIDREKIEKLKKQYYEHKMLWETVKTKFFKNFIFENKLIDKLVNFLQEKLVLLNEKDIEFTWDQVISLQLLKKR